MKSYKVYVKTDAETSTEVFEVSEDNKVVYRCEQLLGYALCDLISIDINNLLSNTDNEDLLRYSQVFLMTPQKSEYQYIKNIYDVIKGFIFQNSKSINFDFKRRLCTNIENIDGKICKVIYPDSISDILFFLFYETVDKNIIFKKCKRCERMFPIYYHRNIQFCERTDKHIGKTCRQIKGDYDYIKYDPNYDSNKQMIISIFCRAYRRQRRRVDHDSLTVVKFKIWSKKARKQRDLCLNGKITIQEFEKWIIDNDRNYDEED